MKFAECALMLLFVAISEGNDFWATRKVNCGVNMWSQWSASAPVGTRIRTRPILRQSGGTPTNTRTIRGPSGDLRTNRRRIERPIRRRRPLPSTRTRERLSRVKRQAIVRPGNDTQIRTRTVVRHPRNGGDPCPPLQQTRGPGVKTFRGRTAQVQGVFGIGGDESNGLTLLPRDLLVIIDMGGSISRGVWRNTLRKLADLIEKLCGTIGPGPQNNRIAVVTFSTRVVLNFDFKTHWSMANVRRAILAIPQDRRLTCTGDAFVYAQNYMIEPNTGSRSATESVKEVLVLTDGRSNCGAALTPNIQRLQVKAFVYASAIGTYGNAGQAEIESMASTPRLDHLFGIDLEFLRMVDIVRTYPDACAPFELT